MSRPTTPPLLFPGRRVIVINGSYQCHPGIVRKVVKVKAHVFLPRLGKTVLLHIIFLDPNHPYFCRHVLPDGTTFPR